MEGCWVPQRRSLCASTAPPEGCTHIDEVLSAAPPDVEGPPCRQAHFAPPRWRMPPQVETWTRLALEPVLTPKCVSQFYRHMVPAPERSLGFTTWPDAVAAKGVRQHE